jgi:hypothetical protein
MNRTFLYAMVLPIWLWSSSPARASTAGEIFDCHRAVIQEGKGGYDGVLATFDNLQDMVDYRDDRRELSAIHDRCLELYDSSEPQELMPRIEYYELLQELLGEDIIGGDQVLRKMFILMSGLRDNVARCRSVSAAGMYAVILGGTIEGSMGVCHNLEGEIYTRVVGGYGLSLGVGINGALFFDNQLGLYPEETGHMGALLGAARDTVVDALFDRDGDSRAHESWRNLFNFNIFMVQSMGAGVVLPISFMAESIDHQEQVEQCFGAFQNVLDESARPRERLGAAIDGLGECIQGASGVALGAGLQFAIVFELPVHFHVPFFRPKWLLNRVVYNDVSTVDIALVHRHVETMQSFAQ